MTIPSGADTASSIRQHTLGRSAHWRGERHQRRADVLVVHPAEADTGIRFVRYGEVPTTGIPARWDSVVDTRGGIVLGNTHGSTLRGAIPLLAALRVAGVDNAVVEVHGSRIAEEVSDFDFYLGMLDEVGVQAQAAARRLLRVVDTVEVRDSYGFATISPDAGFRACINLATIQLGGNTDKTRASLLSDFTEPYAGFSATPGGTREAHLVHADDAGGSRPLREICALPEALRATVVDMIGHLALAGAPVAGYVRSHGRGPRLYQELLHAVMGRGAVSLTTVDAHRARHNSVSGTNGT
ncbi:MAG: UDP-3-O-acyl-N-acetylglucosamine deacetylase [Sulfuricaulis sp.]|uniref:UDP-3-O-acyl-N-acetylglucosamine deacetylase n=1 Tax=Sulfuricaulis sp. TaxID=2003553 RepID=UPI003C3463D8